MAVMCAMWTAVAVWVLGNRCFNFMQPQLRHFCSHLFLVIF